MVKYRVGRLATETGEPMKRIVAGVLFCLAIAAYADTIDATLIQTSGDPSVASGKFYGYRDSLTGPGDEAFAKAAALAESEHVPLVVIWSNEDCHFCDDFTANLNDNKNKASVTEWLSTNRAVFAFFKDKSGDNAPARNHKPKACYDAWNFAANTCGSQPVWPLVGFRYVRSDGVTNKWGHTQIQEMAKSFAWLKARYSEFLADNKIDPTHCGAGFAASGTEFDRYEAEPATTNILIDLVRDADNGAFDVTHALVATWPDGTAVTNSVDWAAGTTNLSVALDMSAGGAFEAGGTVALALYDVYGSLRATNVIAMVSGENSNVNPFWFTERTAETLAFGEWTVDIDTATNKVAATEGDAYTIVSAQGSLWCPDCANTDANFLSLADGNGYNRFREWAAANKVALVVVDVPNYGARTGTDPETCASPSMFSKKAFMSRGALKSGLPYLSRKMVPAAEAMAMRARNHFLVSTNTDAGGFHRPEDTNAYRTGIPIFVLLRKDGSVASRLIRFATKSPTADDQSNWENYIARFEEMLAAAREDADEIENNHWTTTPLSLADGGTLSGTISHTDTADWFELSGVSAGSVVRLHFSGDGTNQVTIAFRRVIDGEFENRDFASEKVCIKGGYTARAELPPGERWFAGITVANTEPGFTVDSTESTVAPYSLSMTVSPPSMDPGEIVFSESSLRVIEQSGTGTVEVVRRDGGYGATSVRVFCKSHDEAADGRYAWTDRTISWRDGEKGSKEVGFVLLPNDVFEGEGTFTLALEKADGGAFVADDAACEVTIEDTDAPCFERASYDVSAYVTFTTETRFPLLNVRSTDTQVKITPVSGATSLPAGLKIAYDKASGSIVLSGIPKKAGDYEFTCAVTARRGGKKIEGFETTIKISVADPAETNPKIGVKRPNQTLALLAKDGGTNYVAGTLAFVATAKSVISARYSGTEGKSISFSGNWSDLDETGEAVATLSSKGATLSAAMDASGRLSVVLSLPDGASWFGGEFTAEADWPQTGVFDAFKGYYTVACPCVGVNAPVLEPTGTAILTLDMTTAACVKNGVLRFVGVLPDGSSVSGTTAIDALLEGGTVARVPVFVRTAKNVFGAVLAIGADGATKWASAEPTVMDGATYLEREIVRPVSDSATYVLHRETAWSYMTRHLAYGSYYEPGTSPQTFDAFYAEYGLGDAHGPEGAPFILAFDSSTAAESERYGAFSIVGDGDVTAGEKTLVLSKKIGLAFRFSARTGVFNGTSRVIFENRIVTGTYRGVLTPGWVLPCACGIDAPEMPFGGGMFCFRDVVGGKSVMRSLPVVLDK